MPIEICGMLLPVMDASIATPARIGGSESADGFARGVDIAAVDLFAKAHEAADFDTALIGSSSAAPDGFQIAQRSASVTERLNFLVSHRTGFISPSMAARLIATTDNFCGGRLKLHVLVGGNDEDQQRDGDWLDHDTRYARADEYLEIMRRVWAGEDGVDFEGDHYKLRGSFSGVRSLRQPHVPLWGGGGSELSIDLCAKHCELFMFWGEPVDSLAGRARTIRAAAEGYGRTIRFSVSLRPILGSTEEAAWKRADAILEEVEDRFGGGGVERAPVMPESEGSTRLRAIAAEKEIHDKRLWTGVARATTAPGNSTALVGTPEQIVDSILDYYDVGITTLLIRGFDAYGDTIEYGKELIPLLRSEVARRDAER
jgi:alkanesulfonate monooxygenase